MRAWRPADEEHYLDALAQQMLCQGLAQQTCSAAQQKLSGHHGLPSSGRIEPAQAVGCKGCRWTVAFGAASFLIIFFIQAVFPRWRAASVLL
jgi:hypothetical protein